MRDEIRNIWINALESGRYKHEKWVLQRTTKHFFGLFKTVRNCGVGVLLKELGYNIDDSDTLTSEIVLLRTEEENFLKLPRMGTAIKIAITILEDCNVYRYTLKNDTSDSYKILIETLKELDDEY